MAASSYLMGILAVLLFLLPLASKGDNIPPSWSPFFDNICNDVECGKGACEAAPGDPFGFKCKCQDGWRRTRLDDDDEDNLEFLPCVIPNCSVNYSCMPAPPPAPAVPHNSSFFDPCYWIYCGEGTCSKNLTKSHTCQCKPGYANLLNITAFPCYNDCAIGSDCARLGVRVSNSTSSNPSSNGDQSQATSFLPGKFHWMTIFLISAFMVMWK